MTSVVLCTESESERKTGGVATDGAGAVRLMLVEAGERG